MSQTHEITRDKTFKTLQHINGELRLIESSMKKILAFGDSLTWGYFSMGREQNPYTTRLQQLADDAKLEIHTFGFPGNTSKQLLEQLPKFLKAADPRAAKQPASKYDLVLILAGTNDLGSFKPDEVLKNLRELHNLCYKHGAKTVAISIPEHHAEQKFPHLGIREKRTAINAGLKKLVEQSKGKSTFFDLATELPQFSLSDADRKKYWDDGLHFSAAGYDRFGELVYQHLVANGLLPRKAAPTATAAADGKDSKTPDSPLPPSASSVATSAASASVSA